MIIHIGLGKTATTALQTNVFRELRRKKLLTGYNPKHIMHRLKDSINHNSFDESLISDIKELDNHTLISLESLCGWNPATWEKRLKLNKTIFPKSAIILFTIREPHAYLRSVYQQMIHQGHIVAPDKFFYDNENHEKYKIKTRWESCEIFNVDQFNIRELVKRYDEHFHKVIIIAYENLKCMHFLSEFVELSEEDRLYLSNRFSEKSVELNVSYSELAMTLTFIRERVLNLFGLKSLSSYDEFLFIKKPVLEEKSFKIQIFLG